MVMVMMPSAAMPTATEAEGYDRCTRNRTEPHNSHSFQVRPIIAVAPMPVPVAVVAPIVPVSGAEVGRPGRWIYPRTAFRSGPRGEACCGTSEDGGCAYGEGYS